MWAVVAELQQAFHVWAEPSGLRFAFTEQETPGAIRLSFSIDDESDDPAIPLSARILYKYDGPGGILAQAVKGESVTFDGEEKWLLQDEIARRVVVGGGGSAAEVSSPGEFSLLAVAVHEIGHVLGLGHINKPHATMSPYYNADHVRLSHDDVMALQKLYPEK